MPLSYSADDPATCRTRCQGRGRPAKSGRLPCLIRPPPRPPPWQSPAGLGALPAPAHGVVTGSPARTASEGRQPGSRKRPRAGRLGPLAPVDCSWLAAAVPGPAALVGFGANEGTPIEPPPAPIGSCLGPRLGTSPSQAPHNASPVSPGNPSEWPCSSAWLATVMRWDRRSRGRVCPRSALPAEVGSGSLARDGLSPAPLPRRLPTTRTAPPPPHRDRPRSDRPA